MGEKQPHSRRKVTDSPNSDSQNVSIPDKVQGMPNHIEAMLSKRALQFMWVGSSPQVNEQTMYLLIKKGGRALVDIRSRNKAIDVMWLKLYLSYGPDRLVWANIADSLIAMKSPKSEGKIDPRYKSHPPYNPGRNCPPPRARSVGIHLNC